MYPHPLLCLYVTPPIYPLVLYQRERGVDVDFGRQRVAVRVLCVCALEDVLVAQPACETVLEQRKRKRNHKHKHKQTYT